MANLEFLQKELIRVTEFIRFSDQKSAFLSLYYSSVVWFLMSRKELILSAIQSHKNGPPSIYILFLIGTVALLILGLYFLLQSIFPQLNNPRTKKSLIYFDHVSKMDYSNYFKKMKNVSTDELENQMIEQLHTNSVIAHKKLKSIQLCSKIIFILILLISGLFIL